ncbi:MAG: response regulator [Deltaproteobacteria bacterium]|nr:response regulator [Deltaproteobacteria bacterium]
MTGSARRILVVDDSQTIRMQIREELEEGGYEVIEAKNGLEALIQAASPSPPDLITLDIEMPKMNGFETCRKLREARYARFVDSGDHRVPIIFITGNDTIEDRKKGFELGAVDFIAKPFQKGGVLAVANKILNPPLMHKGIQALVADDNIVARKIASLCLSREGIEVHEAEDGKQACEIMHAVGAKMDIVITDLVMPNMDGMQLCRHIRQDLGRQNIPIIVLTAMSDLSEILEVFKVGASDYLVKPFAKEELLARINVHIERNKVNRELRETIKLLKEANEKVEKMSVMDPLTGCYNRGYLNKQIEIEIKRSIRYRRPLAIILSDIDHFKKVNDSYGHQTGDTVLIRFVEILKNVIRSDMDWIARFGGEEFLVILPETTVSNAGIVAEKLRSMVSHEPICCEDVQISITSSFGVTGIDPVTQPILPSFEQMLKAADENLYRAKKEGRNKVVSSLL